MFVPGAVFTIQLQGKIKEKLEEDAIYFPEVLGKNLKAAHPTLLYISTSAAGDTCVLGDIWTKSP